MAARPGGSPEAEHRGEGKRPAAEDACASPGAVDIERCLSTSAMLKGMTPEEALRKHRDRTLTDATLLFSWTKSGVDFLAPVVWAGAPLELAGVLLVLAAIFWLLGCASIAAGIFELAQSTGLWTALLWLVAGCCYAATLQIPDSGMEPGSVVAAWGALLSATCWIAAAAFTAALEGRLLRVTRAREVVCISLWTWTGIFFFGACADPGLDAATKWTYTSSSVWWCVGCLAWLLHFARGGSLLRAPDP